MVVWLSSAPILMDLRATLLVRLMILRGHLLRFIPIYRFKRHLLPYLVPLSSLFPCSFLNNPNTPLPHCCTIFISHTVHYHSHIYQYCTSTVCIDTSSSTNNDIIPFKAIAPAFKSETAQIAWTRPGPRLGPFRSAFSNLVILLPFHYTTTVL